MPRWGKRRLRISKLRFKRLSLKKRRLIFFSLLISFFLFFQTFLYIEKNLEPILVSIAQARVKQIATNAVNDAISKKIAQNTNFKDLIEFDYDNNGIIRAATFNYSEYARIVGEATARVELTLNELEKLKERIKLGAAFESELLADIGPEIPISIVPIGSVEVMPRLYFQDAGINGVIMIVLMDIKAEVQVVIPFVTEPTVIKTSIPIAQSTIFGEVPQFYYDGKGTYYGTNPSSSPNVPPIQIVPNMSGTPYDNSQGVFDSLPSISEGLYPYPLPGVDEFQY